MDDSLFLTDQHREVRAMVRDFARNEIAPIAREADATAEFPWATVAKMAELGLLGIPWPEEVGGTGMDYLSYIVAIHELAKVDASHAITVSAHTTLGTSPIVDFGTAAQKSVSFGFLVKFGGITEGGAMLNETWEMDITTRTWTQRSPAHSPPRRYAAAMAYRFATEERAKRQVRRFFELYVSANVAEMLFGISF